MRKKLLALALVGVMVFAFAACAGDDADTNTPPDTGTTPPADSGTTPDDTANAPDGETAGLSEPFAEGPILLTSAGQSADYQMVGTIMNNLEMEHTMLNLATSADLDGIKTLVVAVGGSTKGLGAAGIDADGEIARLTELLDAAKANGISIIVLHTGGESRRGDLSDKFISPIFPYANYAIVVESGDADNLMSGICAANSIPIDLVSGIGDVTTVLPNAFK